MTRQLPAEGGPRGIRANAKLPARGVTEATRPVREILGFLEHRMPKSMIERLGHPEDIAWRASYLASDESTRVTPADLCIDGGATPC